MAASPAQIDAAESRFLKRTASTLIAVAVLTFVLFNLSGINDISAMSAATHVHAARLVSYGSVNPLSTASEFPRELLP